MNAQKTFTLEDAQAACDALVRERARDLWLAALFLPAPARPHALALYAFAQELIRTPDIVSQPTLGEIRLQWWAEIVEGERAGEAAGHPVARALLEAVARYRLPRAALGAMIEARRADLYADPPDSLNDLEGALGETWSALFRLVCFILADGEDPGGADACGHAGVAFGLCELFADLPRAASRGRCRIPRDVLARHGAIIEAAAAGLSSPALVAALAEMRDHASRHAREAALAAQSASPLVRLAVLPATLAPLRLAAFARARDPFAGVKEPAQWRRQWALWRAARAI
jgi:phytoene synthase